MNLLRLLIIAAIIGLVWFFVKRWQTEQETLKVLKKPPKNPELMLQCKHCEAHFPVSEAVYDQYTPNTPYCCEAHRIAAQQKHHQ